LRRGLAMVGAPVRLLVLGLLAAYRAVISPLLGERCRFHPSCSAYATEAIRSHGLVKGALLGAWRVARCSPLSAGGLDPVPRRGRWRWRESPTMYDDVIRGG
jgi:uncharacterized protein